MFFNFRFRLKKLPGINGKYMENNNNNCLHSQFGPMSTVVNILHFVIWIGSDLINKSEHVAINRILDNAFKLAVNVYPSGISLETVPHLRSNKYNQQTKGGLTAVATRAIAWSGISFLKSSGNARANAFLLV